MRGAICLSTCLLITHAACYDPTDIINNFIFQGDELDECGEPSSNTIPTDFGLDFESFSVRAPDGNAVQGWFIYAVGAGEPVGTVMINNPSVGTRPCFLTYFDILARAGYNVVTYDYEGFGDSEGVKSIDTIAADALAVLEWTLDSEEPSRQSVAMIGISLGTGPSIRLAGQYPERVWAVVLDSAYIVPPISQIPSFGDLLDLFVPCVLEVFPKEMDNLVNIHQVPSPLLMLHGTLDLRTLLEDALLLFSLAPHPVDFIEFEGLGHAEAVFVEFDRYLEEVLSFLQDHAPSN